MWGFVLGLIGKLFMAFLKGDINVEVKREGELFHGNPGTRDDLVDQLRMHYSDQDDIRPTVNPSDAETRPSEGEGLDSR
jgi:uncharacterized protein YabE (DUF348 family)